MYTCVWFPFNIGFLTIKRKETINKHTIHKYYYVYAIGLVADFIFIFNLILTFNSAYYDSKSKLIVERKVFYY